MNRRESPRIARAPSRRRAYVARSTDGYARPPRVASRVARRQFARESRRRARGRAVWSPFTTSTPSYTMYTSYHAYTIYHHDMDHARHRRRHTVCPHPYVRILHRRRVASNPSLGRHGATRATTRCERCGAFERDSRRFATRARSRGVHGNADRRATTARRSR